MAKLHESLKSWLLDLGASQVWRGRSYYRCYSGDSEPLYMRLGMRDVPYTPDVIWEHDNEACVFELAFTEDWRAIAGEISLAALSRKVAKVFVITNCEGNKVRNAVSILGEQSKKDGLLKWGATYLSVEGARDAKRKNHRRLTSGDYIW